MELLPTLMSSSTRDSPGPCVVHSPEYLNGWPMKRAVPLPFHVATGVLARFSAPPRACSALSTMGLMSPWLPARTSSAASSSGSVHSIVFMTISSSQTLILLPRVQGRGENRLLGHVTQLFAQAVQHARLRHAHRPRTHAQVRRHVRRDAPL